MEDKTFVWTSELTKKMFQLRFQNDWLFKKKKQPWGEFRNILLENGFPQEMTLNHVRKKWSYTYDSYKIAKRTKNKNWRYYKIFDKHFGKNKILDKYDSWSDEWRLKLITCISEAKEHKLDFHDMWRTVEKAMRSQDLPSDCCVQDMKGLWQHIRTTFNRKHRMKIKNGVDLSEWPLYEVMLNYYQKFDPNYLVKLETESACNFIKGLKPSKYSRNRKKEDDKKENENEEFQWTKDITETFIQMRLQNDWLFRDRKWAWNDFFEIMVQEYGFPRTLNSREICRKWAATFGEYQKAKATNNKSWVYYNLFELYLGEGSLSLNPLIGWQEEWVFNLISARIDLEHLFKFSINNQTSGWREVEKRLRRIGIPLDHSLLDLPEIWTHLLKTFKWKRKFAEKGMLNEQWPYYDALAQYVESQNNETIKKQKQELQDDDGIHDDDYEDDIKLFDLKQRLQLKPKCELDVGGNSCRTCSNEEGYINIFEQRDEDGLDLAHKLKIIGGVEIDKSDSLPAQICFNCHHQLENAYKFRQKCQETDKRLRVSGTMTLIKTENIIDESDQIHNNNEHGKRGVDQINMDDLDTHYDDEYSMDNEIKQEVKPRKNETKKIVVRKRKKMRKLRYDYWKICEVCGKPTRNLTSHLDTHSMIKSYSCEVCDKKFKFKSGLVLHKAIHDPTPKKTCEICGKTFHILAQYRRHFVYHANERKYECETCGKRFNTGDILRVHRRTHTDERPFSCQECGKTFRTAGCVSRHKRIVHKKVVKAQ